MLYRALCACCLLLGAIPLRAQLPGMLRFGRTEGYNATIGYNIHQDGKGYIWIGSDIGAIRFDGKTFKYFDQRDGLTDIDIMDCMPYGNDEVLLIPLLNNLARYRSGKVVPPAADSPLAMIRSTFRNFPFTDLADESLWLSNDSRPDTFYHFTRQGIEPVAANLPKSFATLNINRGIALLWNVRNNNTGTLSLFNLRTRELVPLQERDGKQVSAAWPRKTVVSPDGRYLVIYHPKTTVMEVFHIGEDGMAKKEYERTIHLKVSIDHGLSLDASYNLWITLTQGGVVYLPDVRQPDPGKTRFTFLEDQNINHAITDRDGNKWISTKNSSIYFISAKHFENAMMSAALPLLKTPAHFISGNGKGQLYLGYLGKDVLSVLNHKQAQQIPLKRPFWEGIRFILPLDDHRLLAIYNALVYRDTHTGKMQYLHFSSSLKDICLYKQDTLLGALNGGLVAYSLKDFIRGDKLQERFVLKRRTTAVQALKDKILVGTPNGLYTLSGPSASPQRVSDPVLGYSNITDIEPYKDTDALVSTNAQGLFIVKTATGKSTSLKDTSGLTRNKIQRIYHQQDSLYWLATNKGAIQLYIDQADQAHIMHNYNFYDGLPSDNVTSIYVYQDTAFIATTEGLGIIALNDPRTAQIHTPQAYINTLETSDSLLYCPAGTIRLPYHQNNIVLSLSAIAYESMGNTGYYYRLSGLSDQWIKTSNPEIRFTALPPGNYTFFAYVRNATGITSQGLIRLDICIEPALWQNIYFKIGVILVIGLLLALAIRKWAGNREQRKFAAIQLKRKWAELELEAIKAQINPHFIYNCLNSIQYFNYKKEYEYAQEYLDHFARLIRLTMQYSRQTFITIREETDYLELYLRLEKLRFKHKLNYEIQIDDRIATNLRIPAMLIQPYVENALKHGIAKKRNAGRIIVRFRPGGLGNILVTVEDDGPGFAGKSPGDGRSLGLRISKTRAASYKQLFGLQIDIDLYNKQDTNHGQSGAIIHVNIPITDYEDSYV